MAVYSTTISDEQILERVRNSHATSILLVACGGCANESLAYTKKISIFISPKEESLEESMLYGHSIPFATKTTAEQIAEMLRDEGYRINICIVPLGAELLCIQGKDDNLSKFSNTSAVDLVLALCCPAGVAGIKRQLKDIPVISLLRSQGQLFYVYKDNLHSREIVYEESVVLR